MNSILPLKYVFNSDNVLTPSRTNLNWLAKCPQWLVWSVILGVMIILTLICYISAIFEDLPTEKMQNIALSFFMTFVSTAFIMFANSATNHFTTLNEAFHRPYEANCNFKLRNNSNLIVRQDKKQYPKRVSDQNSKPYRLYVKDPADDTKLIYLGQTTKKDQLVLADTNDVNRLFASYYNYVQKQHLNDKFTHTLYFVKDPKVVNTNGLMQYVLKGDGITLKIKPDNKQSYRIYTDKG